MKVTDWGRFLKPPKKFTECNISGIHLQSNDGIVVQLVLRDGDDRLELHMILSADEAGRLADQLKRFIK